MQAEKMKRSASVPARASETSGPDRPELAAVCAGRSWRKVLWETLLRAALVGAIQICLLETILQAAVHRPESTGELCYMALWLGSLAGMVWAARPLRRTRSSVLAVVGGVFTLFGALCAIDACYTLRVRPNLGLYEEDDWVSLHPGFQWGWRQRMANALWSSPPAQPFAPAAEVALPLDERQPVAFLDLDTGRLESRAAFAADDEAAVAWAHAQKLDLAIVPGKNKVTILGLGLRAAYVPAPNVVPPKELTSQAAVNFWALDRKPAKVVADLKVGKELTGTYVFQTREGGIGFLAFDGLGAEDRAVKMRYKVGRSARSAGTTAQPSDLSPQDALRRMGAATWSQYGTWRAKEPDGVAGVAFANSNVTDQAFAHLREFQALKVLRIFNGTQITEAALTNVAHFRELEELMLPFGGASDVALASVTNLNRLRWLQLWGTRITDAGLAHVQRLPKLEHLDLRTTRITDAGLTNLVNLTNLTHLNLSSTRITDTGLAHLQSLRTLQFLNVSMTGVSPSGVEAVRKALPGCRIEAAEILRGQKRSETPCSGKGQMQKLAATWAHDEQTATKCC